MNINNLEFESGAINAGDCISEAWNSIKEDYWFLFGVMILAGVISLAAGIIPIVSIIIVAVVSGPLYAGVYSVYLSVADGEKKELGAMFDGFKKFRQTVIVGIVMSIPGVLMQIYQTATTIIQLSEIFSGQRPEEITSAAQMFPPVLIGLYVFMIVYFWTVGLLLYFSYLLIMDRDLGAFEAIKLSARAVLGNLGGVIVLIILQSLLMIAGALACLIGMVFVFPIIFLSTTIAYRRVFPRTDGMIPQLEPPSPDQYGFNQSA